MQPAACGCGQLGVPSAAQAPASAARQPGRLFPAPRPAGTAFAASQGGHLFKLEDVALGSWLEWAAEARGFQLHLVVDRR